MATKQNINEIINEIEMAIGIRCEKYYIGGKGYALKLPDNTLVYIRHTTDEYAKINVSPDKYKYEYIMLNYYENTYVGRLENGDLYCVSNKSNGISIKEGVRINRKMLNDAGFYASENYDQLIKLVDSIA